MTSGNIFAARSSTGRSPHKMKPLKGFYAYLSLGQVCCAKVMNQHLNGCADCNKVSQFEASKLNATR